MTSLGTSLPFCRIPTYVPRAVYAPPVDFGGGGLGLEPFSTFTDWALAPLARRSAGPIAFQRPIALDMSESETAYDIIADTPGLKREELDVSQVGDDSLKISMRQSEKQEEVREGGCGPPDCS